MTDRELMQHALECLEWHIEAGAYGHDIEGTAGLLRALLAEPEQELVAWGVFDGPNLHDMFFAQEEAQDMARLKGDGSVVQPLYTTPPQRTWVGLTDEDVDEVERWIAFKEEGSGRIPNQKLVRYIERKLKEKNCG